MLREEEANLGRAYPKTGGPYHYARRAFGDFVGFQTAWAYWIAAWVGNAAIAVAFAGYLGVFWGDVNTKNWLAALAAARAGPRGVSTMNPQPRHTVGAQPAPPLASRNTSSASPI